MSTKTLDLGCGARPRNPCKLDEVYGIDIRENLEGNIFKADLAIEPIPFPDNYFECVSAFDFIEHVPRIVYAPERRFCFVELMNEIYRVLKPGGLFMSYTPAFPRPQVFRDPTHVNFITDETFPLYFDDKSRLAAMYGFKGYFRIEKQAWSNDRANLITLMRKLILRPQESV